MGCRLWATKDICTDREAFDIYTSIGEDTEVFYLEYSRTTNVLGKGKVLRKVAAKYFLGGMDVLHVPTMRRNLHS